MVVVPESEAIVSALRSGLVPSQGLQHFATGLERLVDTDKRIIKGFHSVAREAADATENIQTEKVAHMRKNGCVFYVRT